jgi:uncharacterized protein YqhQ
MSEVDNKDENNDPSPTLTTSIKEAVETKVTNIKDKIAKQLVQDDEPEIPMTNAEEKISNNAKIILLALFAMVSFIVSLGAWVIVAKPDVSTEVLTIIFSSAITGAFTLGGVLINAIWGK